MKLSNTLYSRNALLLLIFGLLLLAGNMSGFVSLLSIWLIMTIVFTPFYRYFNFQASLLLVFSFLYVTFGYLTGFISNAQQMILFSSPVIFYLFGADIFRYLKTEKAFLIFVVGMILCYSFEVYYTILQNVIQTGEIINVSRQFYFRGNEARQLTATLVGVNVSLGMIGIPLFFILSKYKVLRCCYLTLGLISLLTTIHLVNRSGLAICILCFVSVFIYYFRNSRVRLIVLVSLIVLLYFILLNSGIINSDIVDAYERRNDIDLMTGGDRPRRWIEALRQLFVYPFGWAENNGTTVYYVHNMWLDIAKVVGIIPFSVLMAATINSFLNLKKLFKTDRNIVAAVFIGLNACFFFSCFLEPIYGGLHFCLYAFMWGMQNSFIRMNR